MARESSEHDAKYLLVGSTAMELILLLCGHITSDINSRLLANICSTPDALLELLSAPAQKSTEPDRSHSISVI